MTDDIRTHPVPDAARHANAVGEYKRDGYTVVEQSDRTTVLKRKSRGSLLAHLALFFTVGWLTLGVANVVYAWRRGRTTVDRVRVVTQPNSDDES